MKQSRRASIIESLANVAIGYGVAVGAQIAIFPLFGVEISLSANFAIGLLFTVVSIIRSYAVRRLFEHLRVIGVLK